MAASSKSSMMMFHIPDDAKIHGIERAHRHDAGLNAAHFAERHGGIILIAAGIRQLLERGGDGGTWLLAGGMALFMLGDVFFRWVMGMRPIVVRFLGALLALVLGVAGTRWGAQGALAAALAVTVIAIEQQMESRKG